MKISNTHSLLVSCSSAPSLNYLVYLQNVVFNQSRTDGRPPRFPYLDSSSWGLVDREKFCELFPKVWKRSVELLFAHGRDPFPYNPSADIMKELFVDGAGTGFDESYHSFHSWWQYGGGGHATGRVADTRPFYEHALQIYGPVDEDKKLQIHFVYDDVRMTHMHVVPWFVVLSIPEVETLPFTGRLTEGVKKKIKDSLV